MVGRGVIAHEYPGPLTKLLVYGLAATVDFSRVRARQHFPSDVFVGSVIAISSHKTSTAAIMIQNWAAKHGDQSAKPFGRRKLLSGKHRITVRAT